MSDEAPERHLILSLARDDAYVPLARSILARMGYAIVGEAERAELPPWLGRRAPDLIIVDERRIGELPEDAGAPAIVLSGRAGVTGADPRILGAIRRPAGLHELYRLIQQALEPVPRAAPRVATHLPALCRLRDREWRASVLSLSANGCLLRTPEPLDLGSELEVRFELPQVGVIETRAEAAYQLLPDLGLVFNATPAACREAIAVFVERTLAASGNAEPAAPPAS